MLKYLTINEHREMHLRLTGSISRYPRHAAHMLVLRKHCSWQMFVCDSNVCIPLHTFVDTLNYDILSTPVGK